MWGKQAMTVDLLVLREPGGQYRATVLGWPECTASAPSRDEAIERTRQSLAELLAQAEVVHVEMDVDLPPSPLADMAGMWADDEMFGEFVAAMETHRRGVDADEREP